MSRKKQLDAFREVLKSIEAAPFKRLYEYVGSGNRMVAPNGSWFDSDGDP